MIAPELLIMDERAAYLARYFPSKTPPIEKKRRAINFLGGFCACCGEHRLLMLSVDHIQNDGHLERSGNIYSRVLSSQDRARYQALCLNCNQAKGTASECHHQQEALFSGSNGQKLSMLLSAQRWGGVPCDARD